MACRTPQLIHRLHSQGMHPQPPCPHNPRIMPWFRRRVSLQVLAIILEAVGKKDGGKQCTGLQHQEKLRVQELGLPFSTQDSGRKPVWGWGPCDTKDTKNGIERGTLLCTWPTGTVGFWSRVCCIVRQCGLGGVHRVCCLAGDLDLCIPHGSRALTIPDGLHRWLKSRQRSDLSAISGIVSWSPKMKSLRKEGAPRRTPTRLLCSLSLGCSDLLGYCTP